MSPPGILLLGALGFIQAASAALRAPLSTRDLKLRTVGDPQPTSQNLTELYPARWIRVPVDHFHNDSAYEPHSDATFNLRYWFDAAHYQAGGPVMVLQGGETSGVDRLPFLQKGIVAKLAEATNGIGVILEHRYYGKSLVADDFSTSNMRFLSTDQAIADMAYFAKNVVFEGFEHINLTAPNTAYIAYGGSYAGAMVAFLRKLYPDVYWGAISSSGVTEAIYDYWQYHEAVRLFAPSGCVTALQKLTHIVDTILTSKADTEYVERLKAVFGLGNVTRADDFANSISSGVFGLQGQNWDPEENSPDFDYFCANLTSDTLLYPGLASRRSEVKELISEGGYDDEVHPLTNPMLNYIGHTNLTVIQPCLRRNYTLDGCLTNYDSEFYHRDNKTHGRWRSWPYQFCTEWGYLVTGSGVPENQLPLMSRLVDLNYTSYICKEAFNISTVADVKSINKHGGFHISYPRLAIIDGERDPWRAATPHAIGLPERKSTIDEPFILIKNGVHHWDEYGIFPNETTADLPPKPVVEVQQAQVDFVRAWMEQWRESRGIRHREDT